MGAMLGVQILAMISCALYLVCNRDLLLAILLMLLRAGVQAVRRQGVEKEHHDGDVLPGHLSFVAYYGSSAAALLTTLFALIVMRFGISTS
jgi:hypothetical protein